MKLIIEADSFRPALSPRGALAFRSFYAEAINACLESNIRGQGFVWKRLDEKHYKPHDTYDPDWAADLPRETVDRLIRVRESVLELLEKYGLGGIFQYDHELMSGDEKTFPMMHAMFLTEQPAETDY